MDYPKTVSYAYEVLSEIGKRVEHHKNNKLHGINSPDRFKAEIEKINYTCEKLEEDIQSIRYIIKNCKDD